MVTRRMKTGLPRRAFCQWMLAGMLACVAAGGLVAHTALAAPNPKTKAKEHAAPKQPAPKAVETPGFHTAAPHAILMDAESGTVLFEKNADELAPPASLSKLMTAEVVFNEIKQGRLK